MQYGSTTRTTVYNGGHITKDLFRHSESVQVGSIDEAHQILDQMVLDQVIDPAISIETDTSTGQIRRVVKSWTDPSSKLY